MAVTARRECFYLEVGYLNGLSVYIDGCRSKFLSWHSYSIIALYLKYWYVFSCMFLPFVPLIIFSLVLLVSFIDRGGIPFFSHAVAGAAIGVLAIIFSFQQRKERKRFTWPDILLGLYVIWFLLSLIFSEIPEYGFIEFLTAVIGYLVFSFVSRNGLHAIPSRFLTKGFEALASLALLIGIIAYIFLPYERFAGPFMNFQKLYEGYPNEYASFALMLFPATLYFALTATSNFCKKFWPSLSGILLASFFLTLSRGAFIAALAAVLCALALAFFTKTLLRIRLYLQKIGIVLLIAVVSSGVLMLARSQYGSLANLAEKINLTSYEGGSAVRDRLEFWNAAFKMSWRDPLFGRGPVAFKFIFPRYQKTFGIAQDQPHNFYLKTLAENGAPALIFFISFIGFLAFGFIRTYRRTHGPTLFVAGLSVSAVLFQQFVDDTLIFTANTVIFWGLLGFIYLKIQDSFQPIRFRKINLAWVPLTAAILIIPVTLYEFWFNISFKQAKILTAEGKFIEAEVKFKQAEKLLFKRDLRVQLGTMYEKAFEATGDTEILKRWNKATREGIRQEPYNSELAYLNGRALYLLGKKAPALSSFKRAFIQDDKNFLKYHYYYYIAREAVHLKLDPEAIKKLLRHYTKLLKKNAHLTVLSDNPFYGAKLYEFLIKLTKDENIRKSLGTDYAVYKKLWEDERVKFSLSFDVPIESL